MHVGVVTCSVSKKSGGLLDAVRDLYKAFDTKKYNITVYSYKDAETENDAPSWNPLPIELFQKENNFLYSKEMQSRVLSSENQLLHIHGLWRFHHVLINRWKSYTKRISVISPHGMLDPYIIENQGFFKRIVSAFLFPLKKFNQIDCYIALSVAEHNAIRAYGIQQPIALIPNGINLPKDMSLKKRIKKDSKKHLLFLGRLHPKKGIDILLNALGIIQKQEPQVLENWVLDIVGWSQENFEERLQEIVVQQQLESVVVFHGPKFDKEKEKMYAKAHAYILPSHGEGLPMTVLEAWSWDLPVLMTKECNIPEGFAHDAAIEIHTVEEVLIKELVTFFTLDQTTLEQMGKKGRTLVEAHFTWEQSAKKLETLYSCLMSGKELPDFVNLK